MYKADPYAHFSREKLEKIQVFINVGMVRLYISTVEIRKRIQETFMYGNGNLSHIIWWEMQISEQYGR